MRVLILERDHHGHRFTGVRVLLDALLALDAEAPGRIDSITLATTEAGLDSAEYAEQLAPLAARFARHLLAPAPLPARPLAVALRKLDDWRRLVVGGNFEHVYLPYGDGLVQTLGALGALPGVAPPATVAAETILMRGSFGYPSRSRRAALTARAALHGVRRAPFARVHLIDPLPMRRIAREHPALLDKVRLLPDPITPTPATRRSAARARLGLPGADTDGEHTALRWAGCVGQIDERKGIDRLLEAFSRLADPHARLLLAGRQSAGIRARLAERSDARVVALDRYLSETELADAFGALDLVVAPYAGFVGSVSVVLRAAAAGRACLGDASGWMGHVIPAFGLGVTCEAGDAASLAAALPGALEAAVAHVPGEAARDFVRYGDVANAHAHWTALLRERLGLAPDPALRPWPHEEPE